MNLLLGQVQTSPSWAKTLVYRNASKLLLMASAIVCFGAISTSVAAPQPGRKGIVVDAGVRVGAIKALTGVNGAPLIPSRPNQSPNAEPGADNSLIYRQLGVTMARTHDTGAGDIMVLDPVVINSAAPAPAGPSAADWRIIFPNKDADPTDPASYNFGYTDQVLEGMLKNGIEPYFRIGNGHDAGAPPDFDKYAEIVRHIVLHYNKGWANGYRMRIKYWSIWNEPDLNATSGRSRYWTGDAKSFFPLYTKVAKAIKAADATALVGGPTTGGNHPDFHEPFFKYVSDNKAPLDFYDYHWYAIGSNDPYDYVRLTNQVRGELKKYGFGNIPIVITEWGYSLFPRGTLSPDAQRFKDANRPIFFSAAMTYMQDTSLTQSNYHPAGAGRLFDAQGLTATGFLFQAHASFQATPIRLKVTGADTYGFAVLAGQGVGGVSNTPDEIRVLITNYEIPEENRGPRSNGRGMEQTDPYQGGDKMVFTGCCSVYGLPRRSPTYNDNRGYDLNIKNLPDWAAEGYSIRRYRVDPTARMALVDSGEGVGRSINVAADMPPPSAELIIIRAKAAGPGSLAGVWEVGADHIADNLAIDRK
jgi:xylan 1,4-beta-xylosidase